MAQYWEHAGVPYTVQFNYSLPDHAWCIELSRARPASVSGADNSKATLHMPGSAIVCALVPDEDPKRESDVHFDASELTLPLPVMQRFLAIVAKEDERCRAEMARAASEVID